ncbi:MAG: 1-deoxy-D-xylulose-5-phosphate synthase [Chloroflexi bacterium]|nr:1-deoxy-D-xylulose-5-phosphate synthase [Chloroflexota bacterium]
MSLLERVHGPHDLKGLSPSELTTLSKEIRAVLMRVIPRNGGHYGPNLGAVELTLALHRAFESPRDRLFWDVGHQSYPHKLVTGRINDFETLRQFGGLFGYPSPAESEHDPVFTAHAGHAVSFATGIAVANQVLHKEGEAVAIVGDGAMTAGMVYEALDHLGGMGSHVIVVLNDNGMSISENVGALPSHLKRVADGAKSHDIRCMWESFDISYIGPVDGHNIEAMEEAFVKAKQTPGPVLVHVLTVKGKGDPLAEADKASWHDMGPATSDTAKPRISSWSHFAASAIVREAQRDPRIVAITAAMAKGTGLAAFQQRFPDRFFDVGIAEQHAVAFAAGLARQGARPFVGIYSTFLQRAYDQFIHDVCIQGLPVVFAIDRAGIVGDDGKTQQGVFDLSYMRCIPHIVLMAPKDENELQHMLHTAALYEEGPIAVRYPRGSALGIALDVEPKALPIGRAEIVRQGRDVVLFAIGLGVPAAEKAAVALAAQGVSAMVVNARFAKPLDEELLRSLANQCPRIITVEENALAGGFGSAVLEFFEQAGIDSVKVRRVGVPDEFVEHGNQALWRHHYGLDAEGICLAVREYFSELCCDSTTALHQLTANGESTKRDTTTEGERQTRRVNQALFAS